MKFDFEWLDPADAAGPELRATWARLEIRVGDRYLTRLIDDVSRSVRHGVFVPLYPLAEWLVTQWWFLFCEIEPHGANGSSGYASRHSLRSAAEGFALPAVTFVPTGTGVVIEWGPVGLPHQHLEFTEAGAQYIPADEFRTSILAFVSAVVARLDDCGISGTLLQDEFNELLSSGSEQKEFCAAAAALGLDPYAIDDHVSDRIVAVSHDLPASLIREFFAAAEFSHLQDQAAQVLQGIESSRNNGAHLGQLTQLKQSASVRLAGGAPWTQGYDFAGALRKRLSLATERLDSLSSLGVALRVDTTELTTAVSRVLPHTGPFAAVVHTNAWNSPGFAVPARTDSGMIFTLCRALFEYLTSPDDEPLLVTRARSAQQKRNRAFAAEFLVPAAFLREAISTELVTDDDVDDLAAQFGVSSAVIRHQIDNHHLARVLNK